MSSSTQFKSTGIPLVCQWYLNIMKRIDILLLIFFDTLAHMPQISLSTRLLFGCLSTFLQSFWSIDIGFHLFVIGYIVHCMRLLYCCSMYMRMSFDTYTSRSVYLDFNHPVYAVSGFRNCCILLGLAVHMLHSSILQLFQNVLK
jgi:hypothetical protein